MFKIAFNTAIRRLKHDLKSTTIKITGLVLGLSVFCVATLFILNELAYNKSVENRANVYRVLDYDKGTDMKWANTPFVLNEILKNSSPDVVDVMSYRIVDEFELKTTADYVSEERLLCSNSAFFNMLSVDVIAGNVENFDYNDNEIAINKSMAQKYFGSIDAVGKTIKMRSSGEDFELVVVAVYNDIANNSIISEKAVVNTNIGSQLILKSMLSMGHMFDKSVLENSWEFGVFYTNLVQTHDNTNIENLNNLLANLSTEHSTENNSHSFSLQPFSQIYFNSDRDLHDNNNTETANSILLFTIISVGLLSLLVAIINYITIEFSKINSQLKAFGVSRVFGGSKFKTANSYTIENMLVFIFSFLVALVLSQSVLPVLSEIFGKSYLLSFVNNGLAALLAFVIVVSLSLLIGYVILPGRLSAFSMRESLLGGKSQKSNALNLSAVLVVFQILVFIVSITGSLVIKKQVNFALNQDLGFEKEGIICIWKGDKDYQLFKKALANNPNVSGVTAAFMMPPYQGGMNVALRSEDDPEKQTSLGGIFVDYGFVELLDLDLIQGESFRPNSTNKVVITESAVKAMGFDDPIGKEMGFGTVVGVINDFAEHSIYNAARPIMLILNPDGINEIAVKVNTANLHESIKSIEQAWNELPGATPFEYDFFDDKLEDMYVSMLSLNKIVNWCSLITIIIACLGLYGLSVYSARQRIKEIGIRKVNGAKVTEIMQMLNKDFVRWVFIAFILAVPISFYLLNKWLQNFAYQTNMSWWIFILSGIAAMVIALFTVSWQTFKAARRNPVEALRYE